MTRTKQRLLVDGLEPLPPRVSRAGAVVLRACQRLARERGRPTLTIAASDVRELLRKAGVGSSPANARTAMGDLERLGLLTELRAATRHDAGTYHLTEAGAALDLDAGTDSKDFCRQSGVNQALASRSPDACLTPDKRLASVSLTPDKRLTDASPEKLPFGLRAEAKGLEGNGTGGATRIDARARTRVDSNRVDDVRLEETRSTRVDARARKAKWSPTDSADHALVDAGVHALGGTQSQEHCGFEFEEVRATLHDTWLVLARGVLIRGRPLGDPRKFFWAGLQKPGRRQDCASYATDALLEQLVREGLDLPAIAAVARERFEAARARTPTKTPDHKPQPKRAPPTSAEIRAMRAQANELAKTDREERGNTTDPRTLADVHFARLMTEHGKRGRT